MGSLLKHFGTLYYRTAEKSSPVRNISRPYKKIAFFPADPFDFRRDPVILPVSNL